MNKREKIIVEAELSKIPGNTTKQGLIDVAQEHFSFMKAEAAVELAEISLRLAMCSMLSCSQAIERVRSTVIEKHYMEYNADYWKKFKEEWFNEKPIR